MAMRKVNPTFFATQARFRTWLARNHDKATELFVGFYRKDSGKGGLTYAEALEEALCFGWIDGVRLPIDHESYTNRFSPRKTNSYWSAVNIARAKALQAAGRIMPPGLAAFERRDEERAARYSFEAKNAAFDAPSLKKFRSNRKAWAYFSAKAPGYRRITTFWVMSAKQQATRDRRLATLIAWSAQERPMPLLGPASKRKI
jgi:uncharacterized protein YdeI (YjbR/CyaY-like superfamily)